MATILAPESNPTSEAPLEGKIHPKISGLLGTIQKFFHSCWAMLRSTQTDPTRKTREEIALVHRMVRLCSVLASKLHVMYCGIRYPKIS